ncbi:MAG: PEP-utilizing enzyme [Patescibacteria group bacterium]
MYKNSVVHRYYINQRIKNEHEQGYKYFKRPKSFVKYTQDSDKILKRIQSAKFKFSKTKPRSLSDKKIHELFNDFLDLLNSFSELYTKTEAEKLRRFEATNNQKIKEALFEVGKIRLRLRRQGEGIFQILLGKVLKEIVRRFGVKVKDWFFYNFQEAQALFQGRKVSPKVIAQRQKGYALLKMNGRSELLIGKDFKKAWQLVKSLTQEDKKELRGQSAYPGRVKGKVELIQHNTRSLTDKVKRFKKGNILVTEMTTPATIVACKKASAIVTDEGGVLCHAAIISREFKKPCIVGTKQATQILKDGDLIEVDANEGLVKFINLTRR